MAELIVNEMFDRELVAAAGRSVEDLAAEYAAAVVRRMEDSPRTGRVYERDGEAHQSSGPGEAPAPWSRELVDGIAVEVVVRRGITTAVYVVVTSKAGKYVKLLEFGTAKMWPRPAWLPALDDVRGKYGVAPLGRAAAVAQNPRG